MAAASNNNAAIISSLAKLSSGCQRFEANVSKLSKLNQSLVDWNENFGTFLGALELRASCIDFNVISLIFCGPSLHHFRRLKRPKKVLSEPLNVLIH